MTTLPKNLSSQLAFGITKSTDSQTPGGVLIAMARALLSGTQGEKLRRWGLFHFIVVSQETIPQETAYIQKREESDELCPAAPISCRPPDVSRMSPTPTTDASPFSSVPEGQGRCLSVATPVPGWQKEVGGAQGVKTQCEVLLGSYSPGVPHWNILCPPGG